MQVVPNNDDGDWLKQHLRWRGGLGLRRSVWACDVGGISGGDEDKVGLGEPRAGFERPKSEHCYSAAGGCLKILFC